MWFFDVTYISSRLGGFKGSVTAVRFREGQVSLTVGYVSVGAGLRCSVDTIR